mmetsp:Transcript_16067/g.40708  ORF Transcript_16067/g.40708 Transcript_16067/m.40708 type:complete len:246 (-) Transcript_16067:149-886(-)
MHDRRGARPKSALLRKRAGGACPSVRARQGHLALLDLLAKLLLHKLRTVLVHHWHEPSQEGVRRVDADLVQLVVAIVEKLSEERDSVGARIGGAPLELVEPPGRGLVVRRRLEALEPLHHERAERIEVPVRQPIRVLDLLLDELHVQRLVHVALEVGAVRGQGLDPLGELAHQRQEPVVALLAKVLPDHLPQRPASRHVHHLGHGLEPASGAVQLLVAAWQLKVGVLHELPCEHGLELGLAGHAV